MEISSVINQTFQTTPGAPGKHILPRYLYHFTDKDNLKKIMAEGALKGSRPDSFRSDGVYMVDMNNFLKYWKSDKTWNKLYAFSTDGSGTCSLAYVLMKQASKNNRDLVCLKIPRKALEPSKLRIRSQNRILCDNPEQLHIKAGEAAVKKGLFNQRKEALEYIYEGYIPFKNIQVAGGTKLDIVSRLGFESGYTMQHKLCMKLLLKIFKGQPESIGIASELQKVSVLARLKSFFR